MALTFQQVIATLNDYWQGHGCTLIQPYDMEVGAGTFHPATCLRSIGPEPWFAAYVQPSRRPTDGRYGDNPNRLQHYYQYQVLLKPSPTNMQELYLGSLKQLGIDHRQHDIRFIEDDWESPTLGAWGLGWEVWLDGMEVTQYTYFQQVGGLECIPTSGELTYGIERLAMYLQDVDRVYDLVWSKNAFGTVTYGDVYLQNEQEQSTYNFEYADIKQLHQQFEQCEQNCTQLVTAQLPLPAYEQVIRASHLFNLLDARKAVSVTERQRFIFRVRQLSAQVARAYLESRERLQFPLGVVKPKSKIRASHDPSTNPAIQHHQQMANWLFEMGCEELPPKAIATICEQLPNLLKDTLNKQRLKYDTIQLFSTPRRIAFIVSELIARQPQQTIHRKGPQINAPKKALEGFARSCGVSSESLSIQSIDGKDYYVFTREVDGKATVDLLTEIIEDIFSKLILPKSMRWSDQTETFSRPVRWLTCVYGNQSVPITRFDVLATDQSYGHRFLKPKVLQPEVLLVNADNYQQTLRQAEVIVDRAERQRCIIEQVNQLVQGIQDSRSADDNIQANLDDSLLEELTDLVEKPHAVLAEFDAEFLNLPKECLISTLEKHQRYITLGNANGELIHQFITISNIPASDLIRRGNEKVVTARLKDSQYFWQNDSAKNLIDYQATLDTLQFAQNKLQNVGSLLQKTQRLQTLAAHLCEHLGDTNPSISSAQLHLAAGLCKCDLVTDFVGEFPDLQGIAGYYFALQSNYEEPIAIAIRDHYLPRFSKDLLPSTDMAKVLAIIDKLDSLVAIYSLGIRADGNKDPFSLRRAALGVMRILIELPITLSLEQLLALTFSNLQQQLKIAVADETVMISEIEQFMWERLRFWLINSNHYRHEDLQPVLSDQVLYPAQTPADLLHRSQALKQFITDDRTAELIETSRRINNILKNKSVQTTDIDPKYLVHASEQTLYQRIQQLHQCQLRKNLTNRVDDYLLRFEELALIAKPLAQFFDEVMVMVDDKELRDNRLKLLKQLQQKLCEFVDFSSLENRPT